MNPSDKSKRSNQIIKIPGWLIVSILCVIVAILFVVLYINVLRYSLVAKSIQSGDSITTALLLTPEITTGIARLF